MRKTAVYLHEGSPEAFAQVRAQWFDAVDLQSFVDTETSLFTRGGEKNCRKIHPPTVFSCPVYFKNTSITGTVTGGFTGGSENTTRSLLSGSASPKCSIFFSVNRISLASCRNCAYST